jgi:Transcription termination and cleavage factor C-terminal
LNSASDQEKVQSALPAPASDKFLDRTPNSICSQAQLIMQVLQLSDEQIAALPPEQRQSILVLKEQIAKSSQR